MKKNRILAFYMLLIMLSYSNTSINAQRYNLNKNCVQEFTDNVSQWVKTHNVDHRKSAENCAGKVKIRITDDLVEYLAKEHNQTNVEDSYTLETFFNCLVKERGNLITISYSEPIYINPQKIDKPNSVVDHYLSTVTFSRGGRVVKTAKDLFYVRDRKISKIGKYSLTENQKVRVDYSNFINDYETIGFSYNYGQHFPVGGSFNYSLEDIPFMLSFDFGVNLDGDKYIVDKVDMTDIMNYQREKKIMDPKFFLTITPQLYFKYFAVGCGVGFLYMDGTTETASSSSSSTSTGGGSISISTSTSSSGSASSTDVMFKPMIRPVVKGFIPLTDELYLSLSAGYDMIFGYKEKNGFNVGLGLQWEL